MIRHAEDRRTSAEAASGGGQVIPCESILLK